MIIFLYGPDDWRREQKRKWYIKEFEKKYSGLGVGAFDLGDETRDIADELRGFLRSESLFETKKLAIVENIYEAEEKKISEMLKPIVAKKATIVLISESKKAPKALNFLWEKPSVAEEFGYLSGGEWTAFVEIEAKKRDLVLDDSALSFLAGLYQDNTWGLVTELDKISNLKAGAISKKDLENLDLEIAPNYWATIQGLKNYDLRMRLWSLEKLFRMGDPPPKIFNILASQWREKIPQMAEQDLKIKSGKLDYEEALLDLVLA